MTGQVPNILPNTSPLPDFTVFQPTDAAVMAYLQSIDGSGTFATELSCYTYISSLIPPAVPPAIPNPTLAQLTDIMKYHLVAGRFLTTDFGNGQALSTSLTGSSITVGISPVPPLTGPYTYTLLDLNALVLDPTIIPTNNILTNSGILHTVSGVLRPN